MDTVICGKKRRVEDHSSSHQKGSRGVQRKRNTKKQNKSGGGQDPKATDQWDHMNTGSQSKNICNGANCQNDLYLVNKRFTNNCSTKWNVNGEKYWRVNQLLYTASEKAILGKSQRTSVPSQPCHGNSS